MKLARSLSIIARLVDALLVALVATVIACATLITIGPRLGHPVLVVRGGSMEPAIPLGSLVILDPGAPADLRAGDIVSFQAGNGTIVTHRVTRLASLDGSAYVGTKGDANADPDPLITPVSAIVGRVAWTVAGAGYLTTFLAAPIGFMAIFLSAATLLVLGLLLEELATDRRHRVSRRGAGSTRMTISAGPVAPNP